MGNWPAMLLAPTLALTNLSITYSLVTPSCARQSVIGLHAVPAVSLLVSAFFTLMAWRNWRHVPDASFTGDDVAVRSKFVALVAAMTGFLSCLVIAAQWIPQWVLSPCAA